MLICLLFAQLIPKLTTNVMNELEKILDNRPVRPPMISTLALNQRWQSLAARPRRSKSHSPCPDAVTGLVAVPLASASSPTSPTQSASLHDMTNMRKSASTFSIDGGSGEPTGHHHVRVVNSWNQRVPACKMQWLTGDAPNQLAGDPQSTTPPSSVSSVSISLPETPSSNDRSIKTSSSSDDPRN